MRCVYRSDAESPSRIGANRFRTWHSVVAFNSTASRLIAGWHGIPDEVRGYHSKRKESCQVVTPLFKAIKRGDSMEIRRLLAAGQDPNERVAPSTNAWSPLAYAASRGNTPVVELLLQAGGKADWFAVHCAALGNHAKTVQLLLRAVAEPNQAKATELFNLLKYSGFTVEQQRKIRELLVAAGAKEIPEWRERWLWSLKYGWRWRLKRWLYSRGWR